MMLIDGVTNADAIPVLERVMQFRRGPGTNSSPHNIANLSTPDYQPMDLSVDGLSGRSSAKRSTSAASEHGNLGGALRSRAGT